MAGRCISRVRALVGLGGVIAALAFGASSASAAFTTVTWTGGAASSHPEWSNTSNWSGGTAPSGSGTTIDFPALSGCDQTANTCFVSTNDIDGITTNTLHIDLSAFYDIGGTHALKLSGGLTTVGSGGSANLTLPLTLSDSNLWSITGDLEVSGAITSTDLTKAFTVHITSGGGLTLSHDDEVGDVTLSPPTTTGNNGVDASANGTVGLIGAGQLNGSDGHSVMLNQILFAGAGIVGQLTSIGGDIEVANGGPGTPGKLFVSGNLTLDSLSATEFTLKNGTATPSPGTDFGQLDPSGNAALDGTLEILANHFTCPTLQIGAVYTLVNATGTISGHFSNAPNGSVITTPNSVGCGSGDQFRINYTAHTVTATVVATGPTGPTATAPVNHAPPAATGTTFLGQTVTTTNGSWGGTTPMTFTYQWQRCRTTCSDIPGANGPTYKVASADIGSKVRAVVAAKNSVGSASAPSNQDGPVNLSSSQLKQLLKGEITPAGIASIRAILRAGGWTLNVSTLEAGRLKVNWFFLPPGVHVSAKRKPVLVATGKISFGGPGSGNLKLKLTHAGKRLLRHSHRLKLTSKGTFTPTGGSPTSATKRFKLRR